MKSVSGERTELASWNPTNDSWWMLGIFSTNGRKQRLNPTNGSWWIVQILSKESRIVEDPNDPPTAVGGIWNRKKAVGVERI